MRSRKPMASSCITGRRLPNEPFEAVPVDRDEAQILGFL